MHGGVTAMNCFSLYFKGVLKIQMTIDSLAKINWMEIAEKIDHFTREFVSKILQQNKAIA